MGIGDYVSGTVQAGSIDSSVLSLILAFMGDSGSLELGNRKMTQQGSGFTYTVPENCAAIWSTKNGVLTVKFSPRPIIGWSSFERSITGLSYNGEQIAIHIPYMFDPVITVKGGVRLPNLSTPSSLKDAPSRQAKDDKSLGLDNPPRVFASTYGARTWSHPGHIRSHLQQGLHAGLFDTTDLTDEQCESLHSSHHDWLKSQGLAYSDYIPYTHGYLSVAGN